MSENLPFFEKTIHFIVIIFRLPLRTEYVVGSWTNSLLMLVRFSFSLRVIGVILCSVCWVCCVLLNFWLFLGCPYGVLVGILDHYSAAVLQFVVRKRFNLIFGQESFRFIEFALHCKLWFAKIVLIHLSYFLSFLAASSVYPIHFPVVVFQIVSTIVLGRCHTCTVS